MGVHPPLLPQKQMTNVFAFFPPSFPLDRSCVLSLVLHACDSPPNRHVSAKASEENRFFVSHNKVKERRVLRRKDEREGEELLNL